MFLDIASAELTEIDNIVADFVKLTPFEELRLVAVWTGHRVAPLVALLIPIGDWADTFDCWCRK